MGEGRGGRTFPIFAVVDVVNLEYLRKALWSNVCDCALAVKMRDFVEKEQEGKSEKGGIASSDFIFARAWPAKNSIRPAVPHVHTGSMTR